jgi:hypothetical protein
MGSAMSRRRVFVFAAVLAIFALTATSTVRGEYDGRLPISPGRLIDPFNGPFPPHADSFALQTGARCIVYWDDLLGTPRYVSMRSNLPLPRDPYSSVDLMDPGLLIAGAQTLIDANRDFFGVGSEDLLSPTVMQAGKSRLIVFREGAGGVAIRGANLRIIVGEDGTVRAIKAFLLRDPPETAWDFAPFEGLAPALAEWGAKVSYYEQQVYFPRHDIASLRPVWNVWASDVEESPWEYFFDAGTGLPIERRIVRAEFPIVGSVKGNYPDPRRLHLAATQWTLDATNTIIPFGVQGVRIDEQVGSKVETAVSGEDGSFTIDVPGPSASLVCRAEYWRCGKEMRSSVQTNCASMDDTGSTDTMTLLLKVVRNMTNCAFTDFGVFSLAAGPMNLDQRFDFLFNSGPPSIGGSLQLMAYHHMSTFMDDFLTRAERLDVPIHEYLPLTVVIVDVPHFGKRSLEFQALPGGSKICMAAILDTGQQVTPAMMNHEFAHYAIFAITDACHSERFDCIDVNFRDQCIENLPDEVKVREAQIIEGIADGLAAYKGDSPLFGYYEDQINPDAPPIIPGATAYDISVIADPGDPRALDLERARMGNVLWKLYDRFSIEGVKEKGLAVDLIYKWLGMNSAIQPVDHRFDGSESFLDEVLDVLDESGFTDLSDDNRETFSLYDGWVTEAFSGSPYVHVAFLRGDADQNAALEISDAIYILGHLFLGNVDDRCVAAMDVSQDGEINLSDPIALLSFLYLGGPAPTFPFPTCGLDPADREDRLPCKEFICRW